MRIGMLWFDADSSLAVESRVERAVNYYRDKYGQTPTLCLVSPTLAGAELPAQVGPVELRALDTVLPNHFWIGVKPVREAASTGAETA